MLKKIFDKIFNRKLTIVFGQISPHQSISNLGVSDIVPSYLPSSLCDLTLQTRFCGRIYFYRKKLICEFEVNRSTEVIDDLKAHLYKFSQYSPFEKIDISPYEFKGYFTNITYEKFNLPTRRLMLRMYGV